MNTLEIKRGKRVTGWYKTPGKKAIHVSIDVDMTVEVGRRQYVVGTPIKGMDWAIWVALRPARFLSEGLTTEDAEVKALPEGLVIFRTLDPAFGQVEEVSGVELRAALARGAQKVKECACEEGFTLAATPAIE